MNIQYHGIGNHRVAPCTGAWIEMIEESGRMSNESSLPVRERGLKYGYKTDIIIIKCRSLYGSVD